MLRSTLIAAGAAVLCSASFAQQASEMYPVTNLRDAGWFNVNTQRWMRTNQAPTTHNGVIQAVYDNRCTWAGGAYYTGTGSCEDYIDEGKIPNQSDTDFLADGGLGATNTNNVAAFQFGYCTNFAVPDLKIGFYDSLGGDCAGFAPPTGGGQPSLAAQACPAGLAPTGINPNGRAYYNVGALGLPGDATPGGAAVSCWLVGAFLGNSGFCIKSEGDGVFDNVLNLDSFNWSWQMDNVLVAGTAVSGIIISGEPAALPNPVVFGACTYNLPCDADPLTGATCGTGRGTEDGFWINVDADAPDGSTNTGVACVSGPAAGTTCYWFGGYAGNPYGSFWMLMIADGSCDDVADLGVNLNGCPGQTAPTTTQGCNSTVSWAGLPSASSNQAFNVTFSGLNVGVNGTVFYGINGRVNVAWSNHSALCVKAPTQRLNGVAGASGSTGGTAGQCNGSYTFDMNNVIQGAGLLGTPMAAGQAVDMQAWTRDPANPKTTVLSDKLQFTVLP
jgi:hypothetical protein